MKDVNSFFFFQSKRSKVTGEWRKLLNEEFHNLSSSPIIRVIKSSLMSSVGHVTCIGELINAYNILKHLK
jgi:hypothetical protein